MKKKLKIDYEAIALFVMAKKHNKKLNEYVKALYGHFNIKEDEESDVDLWHEVLEDNSHEEMFEIVKEQLKILRKRKTKGGLI